MYFSLSTKVLIVSFLLFIISFYLSFYFGIFDIVSVIGVLCFFTFIGTLIFKGRYTILRELQRQNREYYEDQKIKKLGKAIGSGMREGLGPPRGTTVIINNPPPKRKPFHIFDFGQHANNLGKTLTSPAHRPKGYKKTHLEKLVEDE